MGRTCLMPNEINALTEKLNSGEISTQQLQGMASDERSAYLKNLLGEDGGHFANDIFERKLLLKNQQKAMTSFIEKMSDVSEPARRDMLSKVSRMENILSQTDETKFLSQLAETKLGAKVTVEEANKLLALSKDAASKESLRGTANRSQLGDAKVAFDKYVVELKNPQNKEGFISQATSDLKATKGNPLTIIKGVGGVTKSIKAALDNSALLRQGFRTLITNPEIGIQNSVESFQNLAKGLQGKEIMDVVNSDIFSRINTDRYRIGGLATGMDEAIPATLQEKIPGIGRFFKATDEVFKAYLFKSRADLFDKYLSMAEKAGVDINDKEQLKGIGNLVNSMTGRGNLGKLEGAGDAINNVFFSPRFFKSQLDILSHPFGFDVLGVPVTKFQRQQAQKTVAKMIVAIGGVMATANAISPGSAEYNPLSSDFGKIKVNNTRFDITGNLGSVITLIAREALSKTKSSQTGKITPIDSGKFGSRTSGQVLGDFTRNKLSPLLGTAVNLKTGSDSVGNKFGLEDVPDSLFAPLPLTNYLQTMTSHNSANLMAVVIADFLGVSTNTYSKKDSKTTQGPLKMLYQKATGK